MTTTAAAKLNGSMIKLWEIEGNEPKMNKISDLGYYLNTQRLSKKMDYLNQAKLDTELFWKKVEEQGGSYHCFKKQTFSAVYPRTVNYTIL